MTLLRVYAEDDAERVQVESAQAAQIAALLAPIGVAFERWPARVPLLAGREQLLLAAYAAELRALPYQTYDVVSMTPEHPERARLRQQFLREHVHAEDEVRFFAAGRGLFCLHAAGSVYQLLCEGGDLIRVPAGTPHWFDMGPQPRFAAIRGFDNRQGWVPQFTGAPIAERFATLERFAARERESALLLDIEGTLSPSAFVRDVLFPYARRALPGYLEAHAGAPAVDALLRETCREAGLAADERQGALAQLLAWSDADAKRAPLKELQGLVWEAGYRAGELRAPLYPDAIERLGLWHELGIPLHVFSSGSVQAQRLFFAHSEAGDLSSWFGAHFDTRTGPKHDPLSYRAIAKSLGLAEAQLLFLSDSAAEVRAARLAGLRVCQICRPQERLAAAATETDPHSPSAESLRDVSL